MAPTRLADVIVPEIFAPYVLERTADLSALYQSSIIESNEELNSIATGGGSTANMPFFQDLSGSSELLSETVPLTVNNITSARDICSIHQRGKAWGANFLAKAKSGADPMAQIADLVADWWARDMQATLIATLRGVFASATMASEQVLDLSIEAGNAATADNLISSGATLNALKKLGDATNAITAIAMHSDIYYSLLDQDVIQFDAPSEQGISLPRYKGRQVIVDDGMPKVAGTTSGFKYDTYLFGAGSINYGEATLDPMDAVETDRDSLQGDDYLVNRRRFVLHPVGVRWQGTPAGTSPSNGELAVGTNWSRVYTKKNTRLILLRTNG
ncbi:major capsid protein [Leptolyngbya sp. FACHB-16]|uniref:major capsid protein n=1 Tax=unclassified Leptolyngbya TaxID=2650499 RepID=UPI0016832F07|nr:major capsid protein [Leptolyngbya sp. FACHB-16]MBD2156227.1 coat protein [Leptolyngbya sp. FACHB-16]